MVEVGFGELRTEAAEVGLEGSLNEVLAGKLVWKESDVFRGEVREVARSHTPRTGHRCRPRLRCPSSPRDGGLSPSWRGRAGMGGST